ncbi:hypothetical protein BC936DRAFT_140892, partial [Jimgerdemannia flammicorona]
FRFNPTTLTWSKNTPAFAIAQRFWHTANLLPTGMIVIIGGMSQSTSGTAWNIWVDMTDTPSYDTSTGMWRRNTAQGTIPPSRSLHTTTLSTDGYSLIIYAGTSPAPVNGVIPSVRPTSGGSELTLGDVWVLDTNTYTWSSPKLTGFAPSNRYGHTAVQVGTQMIVMGGSTGQNYTASLFGDTAVLDTNQWTWLAVYTPPAVWPDVFNTTKPSPTGPSNTAISADSNPPALGMGAIAGISIGAIAVLGIAGAFFFVRRRRQPLGSLSSEHANAQPLIQPPHGQHDSVRGPIYDAYAPKSAGSSQVIELPNEQYNVPPPWTHNKPDQAGIEPTSVKPDERRIESHAHIYVH